MAHSLSVVLPVYNEETVIASTAELLYKLTRAGYAYREVGVRHLPRLAGKATGAHPRVIARALREVFFYARKWQHEEIAVAAHTPAHATHS